MHDTVSSNGRPTDVQRTLSRRTFSGYGCHSGMSMGGGGGVGAVFGLVVFFALAFAALPASPPLLIPPSCASASAAAAASCSLGPTTLDAVPEISSITTCLVGMSSAFARSSTIEAWNRSRAEVSYTRSGTFSYSASTFANASAIEGSFAAISASRFVE